VRTLAHLSDLHFGRVDEALRHPLREALERVSPALLVVSGDLTQRARPAQFREARAYLDTLPGPQLVVPGNHDVPLYNVFQRFLSPLGRYRRIVAADLEPTFVDGEIAVAGVNTARALVFKGGRINEEQAARLRSRLCTLPPAVTRIVVTHHPFDVPPGGDEAGQVVRPRAHGAAGARRLRRGHPALGTPAPRACRAHRRALRHRRRLGAGSARGHGLSTRSRGETNSFNVLRVSPGSRGGRAPRLDRQPLRRGSARVVRPGLARMAWIPSPRQRGLSRGPATASRRAVSPSPVWLGFVRGPAGSSSDHRMGRGHARRHIVQLDASLATWLHAHGSPRLTVGHARGLGVALDRSRSRSGAWPSACCSRACASATGSSRWRSPSAAASGSTCC